MEVSDQSVSDSGEVEGGGDLVQEAYIYLTEHRYPWSARSSFGN